MVVGLSFLLIIPMVIVFYNHSGALNDDINIAQIERVSQELIAAAEEVYYQGPPSQQRITIFLPQGLQEAQVQPQLLLFIYTTSTGDYTYDYSSNIPLNLTGDIKDHPGRHELIIKATTNSVTITETT